MVAAFLLIPLLEAFKMRSSLSPIDWESSEIPAAFLSAWLLVDNTHQVLFPFLHLSYHSLSKSANLPSKVLGPASALSRTGIYYGFARVLPQDPDDPDIDDSLSLGGGIESAKSPSSPPTPQQDQLDEEGEESDYYDEDDDENEVVLGVSPVNTHFSNMDRNLNGNANENGSSSSNGNGNDSQLRRNNSLHAGVERVPKRKERQGSKSSTKSNKSIATLMAQLGKSDSNTNEGEGSNSNLNGAKKIESSEVKSSQSLSSNPTDNEVEKSAISNAQDRPTISTSDLNSSNNTSTKHPRNLSAASSSSSLKRGRKKPRIPLREEDAFVFPMVMSVGWNPFYNNTTKTAVSWIWKGNSRGSDVHDFTSKRDRFEVVLKFLFLSLLSKQEVHIIHKFARDFYGLEIRVVVLGYIRPEYNYVDRGKS